MRLASAALALLLLAAACPCPAQDATLAARAEIKQRLERLGAQYEALRQKEKHLTGELARFEELIANSRERAGELARLAESLPPILDRLKQQAAQQQPRLQALQKRFRARLRALYLFGADGSLLLLASSKGLDDFLFRAQVLTRLLANDGAQLALLKEGRKRLTQLKQQLEVHQRELARIRTDLAQQRKGLSELVAERTTLLEQVRREKQRGRQTLAALRGAQARLARVFALSVARRPAKARRGTSSPPVEGKILRKGGPKHAGVYIQSRPGAPVRSPWAGRVVHASIIPGYGQVVIVEHDGRMHTVLGQLGAVSVVNGQKIAAGKVLGAVGSQGVLYLEVRQGAKAVNPSAWLKLGT